MEVTNYPRTEKKRNYIKVILRATLIVILLAIISTIGILGYKLYKFFKIGVPKITYSIQPYSINGSIYILNNGDIYKISGDQTKEITSVGDIYQSFVYSSSQAIIVKKYTNYSDLFSLNLNTGSETQITNNSSSVFDNNLWAFDPYEYNNNILYLSDAGKFINGVFDLGVYKIPSNNTYKSIGTKISNPNPYTGGDQDPIYYPDGTNRYILYCRYTYLNNTPQPLSHLVLYDSLTGNTVSITPEGSGILNPSFSPDGKYIIFAERDTNSISNSTTSIYIMPFNINNLNDSNYEAEFTSEFNNKILVDKNAVDAMPIFSPDESEVAWIKADQNGYFNIAIANFRISVDNNGNPIPVISGTRFITNLSNLSSISRITWIN